MGKGAGIRDKFEDRGSLGTHATDRELENRLGQSQTRRDLVKTPQESSV